MALPVIVAGAARGLAGAGRGLAKGARGAGKRMGRAARKRPSLRTPSPETKEEELPEVERSALSSLISTEVIMLVMAVLLDLFGVICLLLDIFAGLGEYLSPFSDVVGIVFIGGWMWFRSGRVEVSGRTKRGLGKGLGGGLRKIFRGKWKKFLVPIVGEVAPFVGALPFWSIAVYFELTS